MAACGDNKVISCEFLDSTVAILHQDAFGIQKASKTIENCHAVAIVKALPNSHLFLNDLLRQFEEL